MKKCLSFILVAVMLLCSSMPAFASNSSNMLEFKVDAPQTVSKGDEFIVSIGVNGMKEHSISGDLDICFDESMFEYVSSESIGNFVDKNGNDLSHYYGSVSNLVGRNNVIISFFSYYKSPNDFLEIVRIKFKAIKNGKADFKIWVSSWDDTYNGEHYKIEDKEFSVSVVDEVSEPEVILGDVNGDEKITAADARLTLRASAKIDKFNDAQQKSADVNKDGKVNASDARMILRVSAKIDSFDNPVTPTPPVTVPDIKLKADTSVRYMKKGGTAVVFVEVVGKLGSNGVGISGDGSSFKVEFGENLLTSKETGNKIVVLFVSALKNTSTQNIKVFIKGYENSIYVNIPINVSSSGSNDYCGVTGAIDYGAYTGVAPQLYKINEDATSYGFYYTLNDLFDADLSAEQILTNFFNYLKRLGYKQTSYEEFDDMVSYVFTNSSKTVRYTYSVIYDKYGSPSAIMIVCFLK